ncbi:MAG: lipid-A-disaccharide synthase [Deltaproteobacteria bacterium]|nr:lipid-A-disaccharide synthase [Deltaproteobacteria bacterium]MBW2392965.1 lipid-A-disaccharide synthase [Deltaproteobacteria bacterium]
MSKVFVSAGDASGEQHAAALVETLRRRRPELHFIGLGGPEMEKAGVEIVVHQHEIAVGGLVEVLGDVGRIVSAWRRLRKILKARPDLVVLVDAPDFNIPLARTASKAGIPVLYYVSPQVWAWRTGRIQKIARRVDHMAVIFPFEVEVYSGTGLPVTFVGHPVVDRLRPFLEGRDAESCRSALGLEGEAPCVALLPGSRRNEVRDTLPLQLDVVKAVHARDPRVRFAIGVAPSIPRETIDDRVREAALPSLIDLRVFEGRTREVIRAADVALSKPGTVTVEIAVLGTPAVVAARAHPLTAFLMRRLVKVPSFTMPNLIAGETVIPEFLQEEAQPGPIAEALLARIAGPERDAQKRALAGVCERLGRGGAAERTADLVEEMMVVETTDGAAKA